MDVERVSSPGRAIILDDDDLASAFEMSHQYDSIEVDGIADAILSVEEAERCIQDLLKENRVLKEQLERNGSMIRRQHKVVMVQQKQLKESEDSRKELEKKHREELEKLRHEQRGVAQAQVADLQARVCGLKSKNAELVQKLGQRQSMQSGYAVPQPTGTVDTSSQCPVCSFRCACGGIYMDHVRNCEGH